MNISNWCLFPIEDDLKFEPTSCFDFSTGPLNHPTVMDPDSELPLGVWRGINKGTVYTGCSVTVCQHVNDDSSIV